ncbi:hypothetical protein BABINDRAFT_163203 [Babjeviella inositovora NRRL Y-12698]|uniref:Pre-rRNA-processing protein RIX1 n=1 Tax=Babjeviella inositovora NRRL Y-12698 TaxID=984486 RepID=A0A1E3QJD7_9ASCO|nr:uncharacterized protein BABINDRAFT_163203 [Babjeviella inositovora NRRL Y-12698]ODQ77816.1 hypothetical protein BABINDRAFT_163203 [Babjeviella inositovora NRRL Y-12698]
MSISLETVIPQLENPVNIAPILTTLYYNKSLINDAAPTEIAHLVSRTVNLIKSPTEYKQWCGANLAKVICLSPILLPAHGAIILQSLLKVVDTAHTQSRTFNAAADALLTFVKQIKGKPTLTREILTPSLPLLIAALVAHLHKAPLNALKLLNYLLKNNSTTFRPYGNKLEKKLYSLLLNNYKSLPENLKKSVFNTLTSLYMINKTSVEETWSVQLKSRISDLRSVLMVYGEFLKFEDDGDLQQLISRLPDFDAKTDYTSPFPALDIDISHPDTIFNISERVEILLGCIGSYLTSATYLPVKVPMGTIVILSEVMFTIQAKFLSFKREIASSAVLTSTISASIAMNQKSMVGLLAQLPKVYGGILVPHLQLLFANLEILLPTSKKGLEISKVVNSEALLLVILECATSYLAMVEQIADSSCFLRLLDVSFILLQERSNLPDSVTNSLNTNKAHNTSNPQGTKKNKKSKNTNSASTSDFLSHRLLYLVKPSCEKVAIINRFFTAILRKVDLKSSTHRLKLTKYIIVASHTLKQDAATLSIPTSFRELLKAAVLFPAANEAASILPIVSSLIGKDDDVMGIFVNPRFPPLNQFAAKPMEYAEDVPEEEEESEEEETSAKRRKLSVDLEVEVETAIPMVEVSAADEEEQSKLFQKVDPETVLEFPQTPAAEQVELVENIVEERTITTVEAEEDDGSDFEMPDIELGNDDSEDEE